MTRCEVLCWAHMLSKSKCFHDGIYLLLRCLRQWLDQSMGSDVQEREDASLQIVERQREIEEKYGRQVTSQDNACHDDLGLPRVVAEQSQMPQWLRLHCPDTEGIDGTFTLGCTFWSGDATNSSIWNKQKLQGLEFSSSIMVDWPALRQNNLQQAFRTLSGMPLYCYQKSSFVIFGLCLRSISLVFCFLFVYLGGSCL